MCCDPPAADRLPPPVAAMLDRYRAMPAERPPDGGNGPGGYAGARRHGLCPGNRLLSAVFSFQLDDWPQTIRACLTDPLPAGLVVACLEGTGTGLRAGPASY